MKEPAHDWRTIRENWREDGRLQVERRRHCSAGRITIANHKTHAASIITTNPDPLPPSCPGAGNQDSASARGQCFTARLVTYPLGLFTHQH